MQILFAQPSRFRSPLDIPLQLSANFGEIRTDHYHTGYDIRTNGKTGLKVYAAADGYVSRIKVSAAGFGNALYITHPDGYMTVYAHLERYNDAIAKYVKEQQYAKQSFEVDLSPDANKFRVKKGDLIAYSGNTGNSGGPHLHFEIRDASGDTYPLNPKDFLPLEDHQSPKIQSLYVYPLASCCNLQSPVSYKVIGTEENYKLKGDSVLTNSKTVGLGIVADDFMDNNTSDLGLYKLETTVDGELIFSMKIDRLNFANNRYVNAHIDYRVWKKNNITIQKTFLLPGDHNTLYAELVNNGRIELNDTKSHRIRITSTDDAGNISVLNFKMRFSGKEDSATIPKYTALFHFDQPNTFERDSVKLNLPANILYDNLYFNYSVTDSGSKYLSPFYHLHDAYTPLHNYADLFLLPRKISDSLKSKAIIVYQNEDKKWIAKTSHWEGKFLTTKIRDFGDYFITVDTVLPAITPVGITQGQQVKVDQLVFKITDALSGIDTYKALLDDKWYLAEYDAKSDRLILNFDESVQKGNHVMKIIVTDDVNNKAMLVFNFSK